MRLKAHGSTVLILLTLSAAGCEGNRTAAIPTGPTAPVPVASPSVAVRVEGRVIDGDREGPVRGAVVTAVSFCAPGACRALAELPAPNATADDQGIFLLTANLPVGWELLLLDVTRDGYELTRVHVTPAEATTAVLTLLPRITIRSGESIKTRVFFKTYSCGFEGWTCRRFHVDSPSGEAMDIEVMPDEGQKVGLVVGPELGHPISPDPQPRVTVSGGEVWIYGQPGKVTLTAHRR
ncbi:MAG TPA: hypothetical protein VNJ02_13040 [Vicinamibacterales bacterium]|nr:hypothetical protein [Vicinamibacterales bacterium]